MSEKTVHMKITRQDGPFSDPYVEEFRVPWRPSMNIISALMEIRRNPININGEETSPVQWESICLEEVCGACSMLINGKPRQACSTLIDSLAQPITVEPLTSFPCERDLIVNRERMFDALKKVKGWIEIDGTQDMGPGPKIAENERQKAYELSKCMTCGLCFEACPNINQRSSFVGPAPLAQVRLFNTHPTGQMQAEERLEQIMGEGGLTSCGNAANCVEVCPKEIPLTQSIALLNKETTIYSFKRFFHK
ncbi:succinate dehydrogenase iron-sulfur subunit [Salisediminibacterium halotolerans]|uniref:succinate dehydrogenase iron-sulfur subunit n=1 Tax=Salisediminibacterium halotolerans TaxID=517425 RepID=UPI000EAD638F|nr:succinate dehydrogenase iron-sulfur subunit [Salisediminibacterium halotolerans]RLJ72224.1 succinate dehydrogenase / fumarate reductase iron-sulfur subunit [Actinophytocola xinjiangensis]RPE85437.1 succinate dehydrogenase / fumarate reductase iron-sulfur subunit [Salisediminibacterium halotolerans]TWG33394.1 succinate dehydrogenase / fumarate reductase iron-sulfur subunit [Salisediminibacterium halotolerans]GEL07884.1 succinate dehydrogenase iron-sulfur subunit [Salisediminibacterium halotol